jgi:hypothetical protein
MLKNKITIWLLCLVGLTIPNVKKAFSEQRDFWGNPIYAQPNIAAAKTAQDCANLYMGGSSGGNLSHRSANEFSPAFQQFAQCLNQVLMKDLQVMEAQYQQERRNMDAQFQQALPRGY